MLIDAAQSLIATARDAKSTDADMNAAAQSFFNASNLASLEETNGALRLLGMHFQMEDASRAGFLALVCGALVERGCDPSTIAEPLIERLSSLLQSSAELAHACTEQMPVDIDEDEEPTEVFDRIRNLVSPRMPRQNADWEALEILWRPAIAVLSVSADTRASSRHLRDFAAVISEYHEAGHWLETMLAVLDNEPIVVIEPQTKLGILGTITGIVDNFQLNVLLMDRFPKSGWLARPRIPQRVADIARGIGPQRSNDTVMGVWNLYSWRAIKPGLSLPNANDYGAGEFWIWNEGVPSDIPIFDGRRVVLLGPASYSRSWRSQRTFDLLIANLEIESKLTKAEATAWLQRMLAARQAC